MSEASLCVRSPDYGGRRQLVAHRPDRDGAVQVCDWGAICCNLELVGFQATRRLSGLNSTSPRLGRLRVWSRRSQHHRNGSCRNPRGGRMRTIIASGQAAWRSPKGRRARSLSRIATPPSVCRDGRCPSDRRDQPEAGLSSSSVRGRHSSALTTPTNRRVRTISSLRIADRLSPMGRSGLGVGGLFGSCAFNEGLSRIRRLRFRRFRPVPDLSPLATASRRITVQR
jgi:hypothetical protein